MTISKILPSYLYEQYHDDDSLQAFVDAYNEYAQEYLDAFLSIGLPIYTELSGDLLDWVGEGLYGISRPTLSTASYQTIGAYNTYAYNYLIGYNQSYVLTESSATYITTDDIYKRILTWHFFKKDGKVFTVEWLKRRIKRFLTGTNGIAPEISSTDDISITFGNNNTVYISSSISTYPYMNIFQAAVDSGILELPFQFDYNVTYTYNVTSNMRFNNPTNSAFAGVI
jgi:hypothetical protein